MTGNQMIVPRGDKGKRSAGNAHGWQDSLNGVLAAMMRH
jgi:hypothetical protein